MSPTVAECLEHARQCEWYAARTNDDADREFLRWRAQQWTKLGRGEGIGSRSEDRRLGRSARPETNCRASRHASHIPLPTAIRIGTG